MSVLSWDSLRENLFANVAHPIINWISACLITLINDDDDDDDNDNYDDDNTRKICTTTEDIQEGVFFIVLDNTP